MTMNNYTLVPYADSDHDSYIKCQTDAFKEYIIEYFGAFDIYVMEEHLMLLKSDLFKIVVEGQTAGYVYYKEEANKIAVDVFTLLPEFRGKGLGSLILQDFIKTANKLDKPIVLDTFKSNPAQRFYKRNGFSIVDETYSHYILRYGY